MIRFVLHQPRNPKNIGAAARGMANFGFRNLAVVAPYSKAWRETRSAVRAFEVVEKAKKFDTLPEAIKSFHLVVGTTTGDRRNVDARWITLEQLRAMAVENPKPKQKTAILFGSEKSGLSNDELAHCHYLLRIPTVEECPSMNLSQAVTVTAYALRPNVAVKNVKTPEQVSGLAPVEQLDRLVARAHEAYTKAGLLAGWDPARSVRRFRTAFYRWGLTDVDLAMLHGLFRWTIRKSEKRKA